MLPILNQKYQCIPSIFLFLYLSQLPDKSSYLQSKFSISLLLYKGIFPMSFFITLRNVNDAINSYRLSWVLINLRIFKGKKIVIGQDTPSSELRLLYFRQVLKTRDCFSKKPSKTISSTYFFTVLLPTVIDRS